MAEIIIPRNTSTKTLYLATMLANRLPPFIKVIVWEDGFDVTINPEKTAERTIGDTILHRLVNFSRNHFIVIRLGSNDNLPYFMFRI